MVVAPYRDGRLGSPNEWRFTGKNFTQQVWSLDGRMLYMPSNADQRLCIWGWKCNIESQAPEGDPFPLLHFHDPSVSPAMGLRHILRATKDALMITVERSSTELWTAQLQ